MNANTCSWSAVPWTCNDMPWRYDDAGRTAAGYTGDAVNSCVVSAIAIAAQRPYREVYERLRTFAADEATSPRFHRSGLRHGFRRRTYERLLVNELGARWTWTPDACLRAADLPRRGRLVVSVKRHLTVVLDRAIHDTFDPRSFGKTRVYGYYTVPVLS